MAHHYYSFTFVDSATGQLVFGSCHLSLTEQRVTLAVIEVARKLAKVTESATMMNCSYLGHMTEQQFQAPLATHQPHAG